MSGDSCLAVYCFICINHILSHAGRRRVDHPPIELGRAAAFAGRLL
jgi:hypothetical protein